MSGETFSGLADESCDFCLVGLPHSVDEHDECLFRSTVLGGATFDVIVEPLAPDDADADHATFWANCAKWRNGGLESDGTAIRKDK